VLTVFLAMVTWMFVVIEDSPRVGYLTRLDTFMNLSFAVVFAMSVAHAVNYVLYEMQTAEQRKAKHASMAALHTTLAKLASHADRGTNIVASPASGGSEGTEVGGDSQLRVTSPGGGAAASTSLSDVDSPARLSSQRGLTRAVSFGPMATAGGGRTSAAASASGASEVEGGIDSAIGVKPRGPPATAVVLPSDSPAATPASPSTAPPTVTLDPATPQRAAGGGGSVGPLRSLRRMTSRVGNFDGTDSEPDTAPPPVNCSWCACTHCGLVGRAWRKTSLTRKVDIVITALSACVYFVGCVWIYTQPRTVSPTH